MVIITVLEHYFRERVLLIHTLTSTELSIILVIAVVFIAVGYQYFAAFYRESARELKRLGKSIHDQAYFSSTEHRADSMLRSFLYAHFAESLSGLPTIRSYGEIQRFLSDNEYYTDLEDRAAFLTVTNQRYVACTEGLYHNFAEFSLDGWPFDWTS